MNRIANTASIALVALTATAGTASAGDIRSSVVKSHPSQGEVATVADATARMQTNKDGIFVNFETNGLTPGNVHTLWLVTINEPGACETVPCTSKDVLKRTDAVKADVGYAGGIIPGENGMGSFAAFQPMGKLNGSWFSDGLMGTDNLEVHLVINDHGPAIEGMTGEMLSTYRAGCTDESIPGPMPATARADGTAGPNQCRLVQFSIFQPEDTNS